MVDETEGAFFVRRCSQNSYWFSLSAVTDKHKILHYMIKPTVHPKLTSKGSFRITWHLGSKKKEPTSFSSVPDLISAFSCKKILTYKAIA